MKNRFAYVLLKFTAFCTQTVLIFAITWEDLTEDPKYFYSTDYTDRGFVEEYNPSQDINHVVLEPETAGVVEFYAPWCPHCQHFRSHFIEMANEVQRRIYGVPKVAFYGVTCDSFNEFCSKYNINGYPTVLGFKADFQHDGSEEPMILNDDGMPELNADLIAEYLDLNLAHEEPNVLSMSSYSNSEDTRRKAERDFEAATRAATEAIRKKEYDNSYREIYLNAAKSLFFTIEHGIYNSSGELPLSRKKVLIDWLDLLDWSLPEQFQIKAFISDLKENIDDISQNYENLNLARLARDVLLFVKGVGSCHWTSAVSRCKNLTVVANLGPTG